jgi:hypothetical protein
MRREHFENDDLTFQLSFDDLAPCGCASPAGGERRHETARLGREITNRVK